MRSGEYEREKKSTKMRRKKEMVFKKNEEMKSSFKISKEVLISFYQATFFLEGSKLPNMAPRYNSRITSPLSIVASTIAVA